jgi:hypothetical protein
MIAHFDEVIRNAKWSRMAAGMNIPYVRIRGIKTCNFFLSLGLPI